MAAMRGLNVAESLMFVASAVVQGLRDPKYRPIMCHPQVADAYDNAMRIAGCSSRALRGTPPNVMRVRSAEEWTDLKGADHDDGLED